MKEEPAAGAEAFFCEASACGGAQSRTGASRVGTQDPKRAGSTLGQWR